MEITQLNKEELLSHYNQLITMLLAEREVTSDEVSKPLAIILKVIESKIATLNGDNSLAESLRNNPDFNIQNNGHPIH